MQKKPMSLGKVKEALDHINTSITLMTEAMTTPLEDTLLLDVDMSELKIAIENLEEARDTLKMMLDSPF